MKPTRWTPQDAPGEQADEGASAMDDAGPVRRRFFLPLGTRTRWGSVDGIGIVGGERYYWILDKHGIVSMMPACAVEPPDPAA